MPMQGLFCALAALLPAMAAGGEVRARFLYEDRLFEATGWTGELAERPIRGARALLESSAGETLDVRMTDEHGRVVFNHPGAGGQALYARVETRHPEGWFRVARSSASPSVYSVVSDLVEYQVDGGAEIEVVALYMQNGTRSAGGAFNIYDCLYEGFSHLLVLQPDAVFPPLTAYWQVGGLDGTYYSSFSRTLHFLGGSADTDEYDDAIILHEFGHYAADVFSRDESPGGHHFLNHEYALTLSWSEGLAHYLSSLFRDDPQHLDTFGETDYLSFNLEHATARDAARESVGVAPGAACELRVAAALWDFTDPVDDDPIQVPAADFWLLFHVDIPDLPSPISLESFFAAWRERWSERADWRDFLDTLALQGIHYYPDAAEQNNKSSDAGPVSVAVGLDPLTFFDAFDLDWFTVPVQAGARYVFATHDLHNGADTILTLYDELGATFLAENNNSGERDALGRLSAASRILWTSDRAGSVRLRVHHDATRFAARYGSYRLSAYRDPDWNSDGVVDGDDLAGWTALRPDFDLDERADYRDWFRFALESWGRP